MSQENSHTSSLVLAGDTHFGESYEKYWDHNFLEEEGYDAQLDPFRHFLKSADVAILNLETPLSLFLPYEPTSSKSYLHWAEPEKTSRALQNAGIDAVSLANNHTFDLGPQGLMQTLSTLKAVGISAFGGGENFSSAIRPFRTTLPNGDEVALFGLFEEQSSYRNQYHFYAEGDAPGVASLDIPRFRESVNTLRAENPHIFVIAFPHWGKNYRSVTDQQKKQGEELLNAGADIVIGQGAHIRQEMWQYHGKWIIAGIGNFVFHSPGRYQKEGVPPYSLLAKLFFSEEQVRLRLYPLLTDNLRTNYRSRWVTFEEFKSIGGGFEGEVGSDEFGFFREIIVR